MTIGALPDRGPAVDVLLKVASEEPDGHHRVGPLGSMEARPSPNTRPEVWRSRRTTSSLRYKRCLFQRIQTRDAEDPSITGQILAQWFDTSGREGKVLLDVVESISSHE